MGVCGGVVRGRTFPARLQCMLYCSDVRPPGRSKLGMLTVVVRWLHAMKNIDPSRETNSESKDPAGEAAANDPQFRTLATPPVCQATDRTLDADLFATLKSGAAPLESLKLLIPGFELLEELGRGAFGVVYRARDEKLDRQVAIKVSLIDDPNRREQYIKEARSAAQIDTPGIVPVFQVGTLSGGQPFVVQRLIDGSTLRNLLSQSGALDVRYACWLIAEIASVVAKAHAMGMIHRDIKPDNILLDAAGKPWVADFGLAIFEEEQNLHSGERAGTPLYMAPEQLLGRTEWLDGRADIYAMGIMLYEMLAGRTPFDARNLAELEQQVLHRDPKPISQRSPHVPPELDEIFRHCCAKKVEDRYANANALVDDLQVVLADLPESPMAAPPFVTNSRYAPASVRKSSSGRLSNRRKTLRQSSPLNDTFELQRPSFAWRRWTVPGGILLVAVAVIGGVMLLRPTDDRQIGSLPPASDPPPLPAPPANDTQAAEPSQQPQVPQRPFRVSKGNEGTHASIAAAIAAAEVGETITILPGNYLETLHIDRAVRLVGEGQRDEIVIVGQNHSALVVDVSDSVEISNLTLEGNKSGAEDFNTIEIQRGALKLTDCNVDSRSWDCVKLQPQSSLLADRCRFRSGSHPAISAQRASGLKVVDCIFDIRPLSLETTNIPVGIQASQCSGLIQNCTFAGSGAAKAIHWKETSELVSIEDVKVQNCEFGIILQNCGDVHLGGSRRSELSGCAKGLQIERSKVQVDAYDISGAKGDVGIRVLDQGKLPLTDSVQINNCAISGYNVGLVIEAASVRVTQLQCEQSLTAGISVARQGHLHMQDSTISASEQRGIDIEDASATLAGCKILQSGSAGVYIDAQRDALQATQCTFNKSIAGLLVVAGSIQLEQCEVTANVVGLVVMSRETLGLPPVANAAPIAIEIDGGRFHENSDGNLVARNACTLRLRGWDGSPLSDRPIPKVIGDLESQQTGDEYEITWKSQATPAKAKRAVD